MGKKRHILIILLCLAGNLYAQGFFSPESWFAGLGPEINGYTRSGFSFGGDLQLGLNWNKFSFGQKTGFFTDFNSVRVVELLVFFRYYLPWLRWPSSLNGDGPFVQAEAGAALSIERGYHIYDELFPSFSGGAALGWRINFAKFWYVEPALRLGYPYIWGFGVTTGVRFKQRKNEEIASHSGTAAQRENNEFNTVQENERVTENIEKEIEIREIIVERVIERITESSINARWQVLAFENEKGMEEHMLAVRDNDGRLRIQVPSVVFRADNADFSGLSAAILDSNANTLRRVALALNNNKDYKVVIEGHANPTTPEGAAREAEEPSLKKLSEDRALRAAEELVRLGVSRDRIIITGIGSSLMVVPYNERNNTWKNRRVEFILINEQ